MRPPLFFFPSLLVCHCMRHATVVVHDCPMPTRHLCPLRWHSCSHAIRLMISLVTMLCYSTHMVVLIAHRFLTNGTLMQPCARDWVPSIIIPPCDCAYAWISELTQSPWPAVVLSCLLDDPIDCHGCFCSSLSH